MKKLSLQWKLTIFTAILITSSCIILNFFVSNSGIFYMDSICDSYVSKLPEDPKDLEDIPIILPEELYNTMQKSQNKFLQKNISMTLLITIISSILTYFLTGFILSPLREFSKRVKDIEVKNINDPINIQSNTKEIILLQNSFNSMLRRIENAFISHKQFSADAAHELRTPLTIIKTKIDVFNKEEHANIDDYSELLNSIKNQIDRLSNVTEILLEMTQTSTYNNNEIISLSEITEEVLCDLAELASKNNITLEQNFGNATISGNDILIYRAIYNLVENAIKYNLRDGKVSINIKNSNNFAKFTITDTGVGIPHSDYQNIFKPFFRTDKSRSRSIGGAGLGLSLVQKIIEQHGGNIKVKHSSPKGTQIEFIIPNK